MNHKQLREDKTKLQDQITKLLKDFENENDVWISSIDCWFSNGISTPSPESKRFQSLTFKLEI